MPNEIEQFPFKPHLPESIERIKPSPEQLEEISGEWKEYKRYSDPIKLVKSLGGYDTGWPFDDVKGARNNLIENGGRDIYIYFSNDKDGNPSIPRVAISLVAGGLDRVIGIATDQNLDPYIGDVVRKKIGTLSPNRPERGMAGRSKMPYEKEIRANERLTKITGKIKRNVALTREDLIFIYEVKSRIKGFGKKPDTRIVEIRALRNPKEDAPIIFGCKAEQIAYNQDEINNNTAVYIGDIYPGIFIDLPEKVENIFTSLPGEKLAFKKIRSKGEAVGKLYSAIEKKHRYDDGYRDYDPISSLTGRMFEAVNIKPKATPEQINLIMLSTKALGLPLTATRQEICNKAQELGLELAPQEVGPQLLIQYKDQPLGSYLIVGSRPIDFIYQQDHYQDVFVIGCEPNGRKWLGNYKEDINELDRPEPNDKTRFLNQHGVWVFQRPKRKQKPRLNDNSSNGSSATPKPTRG